MPQIENAFASGGKTGFRTENILYRQFLCSYPKKFSWFPNSAVSTAKLEKHIMPWEQKSRGPAKLMVNIFFQEGRLLEKILIGEKRAPKIGFAFPFKLCQLGIVLRLKQGPLSLESNRSSASPPFALETCTGREIFEPTRPNRGSAQPFD